MKRIYYFWHIMNRLITLLSFASQQHQLANKVNFACLYMYGDEPCSATAILNECDSLYEWTHIIGGILSNMRSYGIWKLNEADEVMNYWQQIETYLLSMRFGETLFRWLMNRYDKKRKKKTLNKSLLVRLLNHLN